MKSTMLAFATALAFALLPGKALAQRGDTEAAAEASEAAAVRERKYKTKLKSPKRKT